MVLESLWWLARSTDVNNSISLGSGASLIGYNWLIDSLMAFVPTCEQMKTKTKNMEYFTIFYAQLLRFLQ